MFGLFQIDLKKLILVVLILALPLISLVLERRDAGGTRWYDLPVVWFVTPTQEVLTQFAHGVTETTALYLNLVDIKRENRVLKENVATLKQDLQVVQELKLENDRLKRVLEFKQTTPSALLAAQVVGVDLWPDYTTLKINKGARDGLTKGLAVITHEGVVGYILAVTQSASTVLALTDRNAVIDAVVQRSRARGIAAGIGKDLCRIKYLQRTDDVLVGDAVVTSGLDGYFPKGIPIGSITKVSKKAYGVTQTVEMRPTVDITRVEELLILTRPEIEAKEDP